MDNSVPVNELLADWVFVVSVEMAYDTAVVRSRTIVSGASQRSVDFEFVQMDYFAGCLKRIDIVGEEMDSYVDLDHKESPFHRTGVSVMGTECLEIAYSDTDIVGRNSHVEVMEKDSCLRNQMQTEVDTSELVAAGTVLSVDTETVYDLVKEAGLAVELVIGQGLTAILVDSDVDSHSQHRCGPFCTQIPASTWVMVGFCNENTLHLRA